MSSSLAEFLTQIGAGSLSPTISLPSADSKPPLAALHDRLQAEINSINGQTRDLLVNEWPEFRHQLTNGQDLLARLQASSTELSSLEQTLHGPSFLPALLATLESHSALALSAAHSTHTVGALSTLLTFQTSITTLATHTTSGELLDSLESLHALLSLPTPPPWLASTPSWTSLDRWAASEETRLESALLSALDNCFEISLHSLVLRSATAAAPGGPELSVLELLGALEEVLLRRGAGIDAFIGKIASRIQSNLVAPFLSSSSLTFSYSTSPSTAKLIPSSTLSSPLEALSTFLTFLASHSSLLPPSPYAPLFTKHLTPPLLSTLLSTLSSLLPSSSTALPPFLDTLAQATAFETSLPERGFMAFLPPGQGREEESVVREWSERVEGQWARRVGDRALERVREVVRGENWESTRVELELEEVLEEIVLPPPPPPPPLVPKEVEQPPSPKVVEVLPPVPPAAKGRQTLGTRIATVARPPSPPLEPWRPSPPPSPPSLPTTRAATPPPTSAAPTNFSPSPNPDLEEDAWGFSGSPSPPSSPLPPISPLPTPSSLPTPSPLPTPTSAPTSKPPAPTSAASSPAFPGVLEVQEGLKPESASRERAFSVGSEGDAWGFGEEEVLVEEGEEAGEEEVVEGEGEPEELAEGGEEGWGFAEDGVVDEVEAEEVAEAEDAGALEEVEEVVGVEKTVEKEEVVESKEVVEDPNPEEEEGDAWDFEENARVVDEVEAEEVAEAEDAEIAETAEEEPAKVDEEEGGEWDFDLGDEAEEPTPATPTVEPPTPIKASSSAVPLSPPVVPIALSALATAPASTSLAQPLTARHAKKESLGGWGWEGDDEIASPPDEELSSPSPNVISLPSSPPKVVSLPPSPRAVAQLNGTTPRVRKWKESMLISVGSRSIVATAEEVLREALEVGSPGFAYLAFAKASDPLLRSFVAILSLYRATAPVHHASLLVSVPAIGMQFANDAAWIGDEVEKAWKTLAKGKGREVEGGEVDRAVERMRKMGRDWTEKQVTIQRDALMECLDEANRFLYTSEDVRFAACQRALRQVTHMLERLAQVWKPVMNPTALYSTLGTLVNDVLLRVLEEIEDQADISEEESIRLNKLCKELHALETLFADGPSSVGREVHIWFKFVFLSELLEASMADILFLFDNGHLVDFSTQEISKLVRALFSDSPMRKQNLEHIMKGHPLVSPSPYVDDVDDGAGWS